jgi:hypothetical protein
MSINAERCLIKRDLPNYLKQKEEQINLSETLWVAVIG